MGFSKSLFVVSSVIALGARISVAAPLPVTVAQSVKITEAPARATIVVSQDGQVAGVVPAAIVTADDASMVTVVGRIILPIDKGTTVALFTVYGKSGAVFSATREIADLRREPGVLVDSAELKERLVERKGVLRSLDKEVAQQATRLKEVKEELEVERSVERLVTVDTDLQASKAEGERLTGLVALAEARQLALMARENPSSLKRREAELSSHLNAVATELKLAESGEGLGGGPRELQAKKDLIEDTKYEDVDQLRDELAQIRRRREELEKSRSGTSLPE